MKHEIPCEVVKDLLPSYIDGLTSEVSGEAIAEHLAQCQSCREVLEAMQCPEDIPIEQKEKVEIDFLKKQKRKLRTMFLLIPAMVLVFGGIIIAYAGSIESRRDFRSYALEAVRGDTFTFGTYEQDGEMENGAEEIVWVVLSNRDGVLHAVSKYGLYCALYHDEESSVTWEESSLRAWLNSDFYDQAFTPEEKALIQTTELKNWNNPYYDTKGGNSTKDKVSLLSIKEAESLSMDIGICFPTTYGREQGILTDAQTGHCEWWLRDPGINELTASTGGMDGEAHTTGNRVICPGIALRPCIYIKYGAGESNL